MKPKAVFLVCLVLFLALMNCVPFCLIQPAKASANNWADLNLAYRQWHAINPAAGADVAYQVPITIVNGSGASSGNVMYEDNRTRSDFGDVRFYSNDNVTSLSYWQENVSAPIPLIAYGNSTFWVKMPSSDTYGNLTSATKQFWVYYGNSTMTTASNGDNTFNFFDDFSGATINTTKWKHVGTTLTSYVGSGILNASTVAATAYYQSQSGGASATFLYKAIHAKMADVNNATYVAVPILGFGYYSTTYNNNTIVRTTFSTGPPPTWCLICTNTTSRGLGTAQANDSNFHVYDILWNQGNTSLWMDGANITILTTYVPTTAMALTIVNPSYSSDARNGLYDWVCVRNYVNPEPAHSSWGSEEVPIPDFASVTLYFPHDGDPIHVNAEANFTFQPTFSTPMVNASLIFNSVLVASNATALDNASTNWILYTPTSAGTFTWTIEVFNSTTAVSATASTVIVGDAEVRYMRSDDSHVPSLHALNTTASSTANTTTIDVEAAPSWYLGIRVYRHLLDDSKVEITSGSAVANVHITGTGPSFALWDCPQTALLNTDSIEVDLYWANDTTPATTPMNINFLTPILNATALTSATWNVTYRASVTFAFGLYTLKFMFGGYYHYITNFSWTDQTYAWTLNSQDVAGNPLTNTTITVSAYGLPVWTGTPATITMPPGTYNLTVSWLQNLTLNVTENIAFSADATLNLTCLAYPYTVSSTKYWAASNSTITSQSYAGSVLRLDFNGTVGTYVLVSDCPTLPIYLLNVTYDYATDFTPYGYLVLPHFGNATIMASYELWGLNVQKTTHRLTSIGFASYTMNLALTGNTGEIGSLELYCGTWGTPASTGGFVVTSYDAGTKVLTCTYTFASDISATITWSGGTPSGPSGLGGTSGETGLPSLLTAMLDLPQFAFQNQEINGTITVSWTGTMQVYFAGITSLASDANYTLSVPVGLPYNLRLSYNGSNLDVVQFFLYIPDVSAGEHQIPFDVELSTAAGQTKAFRIMVYVTIQQQKQAFMLPSPNDLITGLFLAMIFGVILSIVFRTQRARIQKSRTL